MLSLALLALAAPPQWPNDPLQSLVVSGETSDQDRPHVAATSDGGMWVSWADGIATRWDIVLQRIGGDGSARFPGAGLLVADRNLSFPNFPEALGLATATNGDALLAFRDTRQGPGLTIAAQRVTEAGALAWGPLGVSLSTAGATVGSARIAPLADGGAVVAWAEGSATRVQRLSPSGAPQWGAGVSLTLPQGTLRPEDLRVTGGEIVLALLHNTTGGNFGPFQLRAQKLDSQGNLLWGAAHIALVTGSGIGATGVPRIALDGAGGAVFGWHSAGIPEQCRVQHVLSNGTQRFPQGGIEVITTQLQRRINMSLAYEAATSSIYAAWTETDANPDNYGVFAQRFDVFGNRVFGDDGLQVQPLIPPLVEMVRVVVGGLAGGVLILWDETPAFGNDQLYGAHVLPSGVIDVQRFSVASTPSIKRSLAVTASTSNSGALLAWVDGRNDNGDIYAQSVGFNGVLGVGGTLGTRYCSPAVTNNSGVAARLALQGSAFIAQNDVTLIAEGLTQNAFTYFLTSRLQGFVANPGGSRGNLCLAGAIGRRVGGAIVSSGAAGVVSLRANLNALPQPLGPVQVLAGETWNFQAWYRDSFNGAATSNFSDAISVTFL